MKHSISAVYICCVLKAIPPPRKKSVFVRKFEIEINAWEDTPSFALPKTL